MSLKRSRRQLGFVLLVPLAAGIFFGRPTYLWVRAWLHDKPVADDLPPGFVDDASRLIAPAWHSYGPFPLSPQMGLCSTCCRSSTWN